MVQPAAAVDDVILLQDAQAGAVGRGVGEDEDLPPLVGGVGAKEVNEPGDLGVVDDDLMAGVGGIAEDCGAQTDDVYRTRSKVSIGFKVR